METFQEKMIKKYNPEIEQVRMNYASYKDGNKKVVLSHPFKHYKCSCGGIELFGFIDKYKGKCGNCFTNNK